MSSTAFVNGSTLSDAGWANDVDTFVYSRLTSVSGTNTVVGTGPVSMTAYATGQRFTFIPAATNTGATTLNITPSGGSALGAKNVYWNGAACVGGEIRISVPCEVIYDGTQFNLIAQPTAKVFGTATNDDAAAGYIGEYVASVVGPVAFPTTTQYGDLTSISLTAGDWDISSFIEIDPNGATITGWSSGISVTSGNASTGLVDGDNFGGSPAISGSVNACITIPAYRKSLTATTTIYLKFRASYSAATPNAFGRISARRVR